MSIKIFANNESSASSDSEDIRDIFYSSSSYDRSSVGSIPWAEDAIKQNQIEWEKVERMFYGEEDLPDEPELRNEIQEWNRVFPHLRVSGKKICTPSDIAINGRPLTADIKEEIIMIHPPTHQNKIVNRHSNKLREHHSAIEQEKFDFNELNSFLEKDLRISSVPMITRRVRSIPKVTTAHWANNPNLIKFGQTPIARQIIPSKSSGSLTVRRANLIPIDKSSNSATIIRMPPILIVPPVVQQKDNSAHNKKNSKATVVLPAINLNRVDFNVDNAVRSASLMNQKQIMATSHFPLSASKLKFSK